MSDLPPPRQPYRGAVYLHAALAGLILLIAGLSGGDLLKAFAVAVGYFVAATAWSWYRLRQRQARAVSDPPRRSG